MYIRQIKFLDHIFQSQFRSDLILSSHVTKQVIMWKLTVLKKENMREAVERKFTKY